MSKSAILVRCPACGTRNRVPEARLNDAPVCGKCRTSLKEAIGTGMPLNITGATFQKEVVQYKGTVLVDCWAPWCGPCRMVGPIMDELAAKYRGQARIVKLNTEENQDIASRFAIQSIPTLLFFKNGSLVNRLTGALPRAEIERYLTAAL